MDRQSARQLLNRGIDDVGQDPQVLLLLQLDQRKHVRNGVDERYVEGLAGDGERKNRPSAAYFSGDEVLGQAARAYDIGRM